MSKYLFNYSALAESAQDIDLLSQFTSTKMIKDKKMWQVHYIPNKDAQPWSTLGSYDNKADAIINASRVLGDYFMIKVTDPDDSVIWSN